MLRPRALIAGYMVLSVAVGLFQGFLRVRNEDLRVALVASMFPFAILMFTWCKADCAQRAITPPGGAALLVAYVALIGIPYYYFRILTPLKALGYVLCAYLVLFIGFGVTDLADQAISRLLAS